jgi:hypothetical protein
MFDYSRNDAVVQGIASQMAAAFHRLEEGPVLNAGYCEPRSQTLHGTNVVAIR